MILFNWRVADEKLSRKLAAKISQNVPNACCHYASLWKKYIVGEFQCLTPTFLLKDIVLTAKLLSHTSSFGKYYSNSRKNTT